MRDILFRAKRLRDGKWVEGVPVDLTPSYCFESDNNAPQEWVMVYGGFADWGLPRDVVFEKIDPDTIGQYTGLIDKNGTKVFEGDIVEFDAYGYHYKGYVNMITGDFCVICPNASPFLGDTIENREGIVTGNVYDE